MSGSSFAVGYFLGAFLECVTFGGCLITSITCVDPRVTQYRVGCAGVFLSFFIAACYVQWDKFSKGQALNRVMALTTGFFGLTTTAVSERRPPRNLIQELTQWRTPSISQSGFVWPWKQFHTPYRERRSTYPMVRHTPPMGSPHS